MKHLEVTFIKYKEETTIEITNLQNQLNVLLGSTMKGLEGAGGVGTASFGIQLNEFLTTYIFIYGYHPNDENWITDERTKLLQILEHALIVVKLQIMMFYQSCI